MICKWNENERETEAGPSVKCMGRKYSEAWKTLGISGASGNKVSKHNSSKSMPLCDM